MSSPVLGRDAVIQADGADIGYCTGVTVSISADVIKEYFISATNPDRPAVLESGNKTFEVSIERAWIYATFWVFSLNFWRNKNGKSGRI